MKKIYTNPTIDIERMVVEEGIALSPQYGSEGAAGQESGFIDYGGDGNTSSDDFWL